MSYYQRHIFFCTNLRDPEKNRQSCEQCAASTLRAYAKERVKALELDGPGGVRVNTAGCLDRCELGPVAVVYPEAVWYSYIDEEDIDEIVERHLKNGEVVKRLLLPE